MAVNEDRVRDVIEHVERHPHLWDQTEGCRDIDGRMCISAITAELFGGRWAADEPDHPLGTYLLATPADHPRHVIHVIDPHDRARQLLGIRRCLGEGLVLDDLRKLLK
jgi:hypothetical protein